MAYLALLFLHLLKKYTNLDLITNSFFAFEIKQEKQVLQTGLQVFKPDFYIFSYNELKKM